MTYPSLVEAHNQLDCMYMLKKTQKTTLIYKPAASVGKELWL